MRLKSTLGIAALAAVLALTGCTGGGGDQNEPEAGAALTIAKPDGAIAAESNNPWIGDSSALKLGEFELLVGPSSRDEVLLSARFQVAAAVAPSAPADASEHHTARR